MIFKPSVNDTVMERELAELFPIWGVEKDCIVSKMGDYTAAFEVTKPEIFTLSAADYDNLHQTLVKAIKVLPAYCVLHFQDWYTEAKYSPSADCASQSFLDQASDRFFKGRPYLDHRAYLYITRKPSGRKAASSASSGLFRKTLVPEETLSPTAVREFLDSVGQFQRILEDGKQWGLQPQAYRFQLSQGGRRVFQENILVIDMIAAQQRSQTRRKAYRKLRFIGRILIIIDPRAAPCWQLFRVRERVQLTMPVTDLHAVIKSDIPDHRRFSRRV